MAKLPDAHGFYARGETPQKCPSHPEPLTLREDGDSIELSPLWKRALERAFRVSFPNLLTSPWFRESMRPTRTRFVIACSAATFARKNSLASTGLPRCARNDTFPTTLNSYPASIDVPSVVCDNSQLIIMIIEFCSA